jgi:hypothetical protein
LLAGIEADLVSAHGDLEDPGIVFRQDHFQYLPAVLDALLETGFARGEIDVRLDLNPAWRSAGLDLLDASFALTHGG